MLVGFGLLILLGLLLFWILWFGAALGGLGFVLRRISGRCLVICCWFVGLFLVRSRIVSDLQDFGRAGELDQSKHTHTKTCVEDVCRDT